MHRIDKTREKVLNRHLRSPKPTTMVMRRTLSNINMIMNGSRKSKDDCEKIASVLTVLNGIVFNDTAEFQKHCMAPAFRKWKEEPSVTVPQKLAQLRRWMDEVQGTASGMGTGREAHQLGYLIGLSIVLRDEYGIMDTVFSKKVSSAAVEHLCDQMTQKLREKFYVMITKRPPVGDQLQTVRNKPFFVPKFVITMHHEIQDDLADKVQKLEDERIFHENFSFVLQDAMTSGDDEADYEGIQLDVPDEAAVLYDSFIAEHFGGELEDDPEGQMLVAQTILSELLEDADSDLKQDRDFVMMVVQQSGLALEFAHEDLKRDFDIVMAAVKQNGYALRHAHESMKRNREIALAAVEQDYSALQYAPEDLEIAMAAVKQCWRALGYAGEGARRDFDIVMAAVQQSGYALAFAHESMRCNREIAIPAVQQDTGALRFLDEDVALDLWLEIARDS